MTNFIKHPVHPTWHAHSGHLKVMMGLKPTDKWPDDGMPRRTIQNFTIWVNPLVGDGKRNWSNRRAEHRAMAHCLICGKTMSAGRTHQHKCDSNVNPAIGDDGPEWAQMAESPPVK